MAWRNIYKVLLFYLIISSTLTIYNQSKVLSHSKNNILLAQKENTTPPKQQSETEKNSAGKTENIEGNPQQEKPGSETPPSSQDNNLSTSTNPQNFHWTDLILPGTLLLTGGLISSFLFCLSDNFKKNSEQLENINSALKEQNTQQANFYSQFTNQYHSGNFKFTDLQELNSNLSQLKNSDNVTDISSLSRNLEKISQQLASLQSSTIKDTTISNFLDEIKSSLLKPQEKKIKQTKTNEPPLSFQPMSSIESHSTSLFPTVSDIKQSPTTNLQADFRNKQLVDDIVTKYNNSNPSLFQNVARVTASIDSIEARRSGTTSHIILQETDNNNYCILLHSPLQANYYCLIPKLNLTINNHNYQTIEDIFNCQGYQTRNSGKFLLKKPGLVQKTSTGEWMLIEPGELVFS